MSTGKWKILLTGFIILLALGFIPHAASAATINVPASYATIQGAVNAASPGDTIVVSPGTYQEAVVVAKRLTITGTGTGSGRPVVDAGGADSAITLGANTDPYQPVEKQHRITRQLLEVLHRHRHPVAIITKGALVTRDLDILGDLAADGLCSVAVSITTLDTDLKRAMEPRAASAAARLSAIEALSAAGVPVSLLFAPVIPGLNDCDMERIVQMSRDAGARSAASLSVEADVRGRPDAWELALRRCADLRIDGLVFERILALASPLRACLGEPEQRLLGVVPSEAGAQRLDGSLGISPLRLHDLPHLLLGLAGGDGFQCLLPGVFHPAHA